MGLFNLKKPERLSGRKVIDSLFTEGDSFFIYPLKVVYLKTALPSEYFVHAAFSVSKKNFKRAVARNLLKRRMREAYRLNKEVLYHASETASHSEGSLAVMFIYVAREIKEYRTIEKSMKQALNQLAMNN